MGSCRLCGSDAGFLKSVHQACKQAEEDRVYAEQVARADAEKKLRQTIASAIAEDRTPDEVWAVVEAEREKGTQALRSLHCVLPSGIGISSSTREAVPPYFGCQMNSGTRPFFGSQRSMRLDCKQQP